MKEPLHIVNKAFYPYHRDGYFYEAIVSWGYLGYKDFRYSIVRRMGYFTFHIMRLTFGLDEMNKSAAKIPKKYWEKPNGL